MDANSPVMEQLIFFYDHSMVVITAITFFLLFYIFDMGRIKKLNLSLIENQFIEVVWTMLPIVLLIFIAIPRLRLLYLIEEGFHPSFSIKILGHQWYWSYQYEEFSIYFTRFYSDYLDKRDFFKLFDVDDRIAVPINIRVRLLVSSIDVIHSWTVQSLGIKRDAIPGRLNQINFYSIKPGLFYGQCSELCGVIHRFMPITVSVIPIRDFINWLK